MTFNELHEILDDENRKLSVAELKQVIHELKQDCFNEFSKALEKKSQNRQDIRNIGFYSGEQNAFQIVLDLFGHLDDLITLPYLLCTSNKFACVIWRDKDGKVKKTYTMPIDEARGVLKEKERLQNGN